MNKQALELGFKGIATMASLGIFALGIRQEQRINNENLDRRFNTLDAKIANLDIKFTEQIKALDTKFTDQIKALDTKFTELDKKIDIIIALGSAGNHNK